MSAPVPEVDAGLVEVLAAHIFFGPGGVCKCGWLPGNDSVWAADHRAHLARAVQGYVEGRVAAALEDAAGLIEDCVTFKVGDVGAGIYRGLDQAARIVRDCASDARRSPETASTPDGGREGVRGGEGA